MRRSSACIDGCWQHPAADAVRITFARRSEAALTLLSECGEYVDFLGPQDSCRTSGITWRRHAQHPV